MFYSVSAQVHVILTFDQKPEGSEEGAPGSESCCCRQTDNHE